MRTPWLTTTWRVLTLGALLTAPLACTQSAALPFCVEPPDQEGASVFQTARGERPDPLTVRLIFELITTRDERFTSTPQVTTNLGALKDVKTVGKRLEVEILLPDAGSRSGMIRLEGSISAEFQQEVDRCPFERTFTVQVSEGSVSVF